MNRGIKSIDREHLLNELLPDSYMVVSEGEKYYVYTGQVKYMVYVGSGNKMVSRWIPCDEYSEGRISRSLFQSLIKEGLLIEDTSLYEPDKCHFYIAAGKQVEIKGSKEQAYASAIKLMSCAIARRNRAAVKGASYLKEEIASDKENVAKLIREYRTMRNKKASIRG